jgi:glucan phosphoethanolaminetransferase (alkaline phosphatase superfamily)
MIQRKQSIYLLLIALITIVLSLGDFAFYEEQGKVKGEEGMQTIEIQYDEALLNGETMDYTTMLWFILLVAGGLSLVTIFLFKNRKIQANMVRLILALLVTSLVLMYWYTYAADFIPSGEGHMNYLALPPFACVVLAILALRGIKSDDALVRSVDRIR